jgi:hypothetical protein
MRYECDSCGERYYKEDLVSVTEQDRAEYDLTDEAGTCPDEECGDWCRPLVPENHDWKNKRYAQFAEELEEAGYDVYRYRGRFYYDGPAVNCGYDEFQDICRATTVRVQTDSMGLGMVVYPA